jgi:hypothetical protein
VIIALATFFERTVCAMVRAYPPGFRERFGSEMMQVYRTLARDIARETGAPGLLRLWMRVMLDGARGALSQWGQQITKRRMAMMNLDSLDINDGTVPLPPRQAALAVLPFLLFGLANIAMKPDLIPLQFTGQPMGLMLLVHPFFLFNWLVLIGLGAGILLGFPRWSFSYMSWALLMSFWMANMSFNGVSFSGLMCLPLAGVMILALLIRRSLQPIKDLIDRLERDITPLALGVYTFYASVYMMYDANHNPFLLPFMLATTLAACLGAWGYFRSALPLRRVGFLVGGLALSVGLDVWSSLTWDYAAYYGLPEGSSWLDLPGMVMLAVLAAMMVGLGWLAEKNRRAKG